MREPDKAKIFALIKALIEGKGVKKAYYYGGVKENGVIGIEYLFYDYEHDMFEGKGWGSGLGASEQRLRYIFSHPEDWEVCGGIEEREWLNDGT